jgi:hypothetical protein
MNIKTKLILATTAVALLSAPASARIDGDEGGASAYPRFGSEQRFDGERTYAPDAASTYASGYAIQPRSGVQRPHRARHAQPQR